MTTPPYGGKFDFSKACVPSPSAMEGVASRKIDIHGEITIHEDGRVETRLSLDEAALRFWSMVEEKAPDFILSAAERIKTERKTDETS